MASSAVPTFVAQMPGALPGPERVASNAIPTLLAQMPEALSNPELVAGYAAMLCDLASRPELNGAVCLVMSWDAARERFHVKLRDLLPGTVTALDLFVATRNLSICPEPGDIVFIKSIERAGYVVASSIANAASHQYDRSQPIAFSVPPRDISFLVQTERDAPPFPAARHTWDNLELRKPKALVVQNWSITGPHSRIDMFTPGIDDNVVFLGGPGNMSMYASGGVHDPSRSTELVLRDPRKHKLPSDPMLRVQLPPPLPSTPVEWNYQGEIMGMMPRTIATVTLRPVSAEMHRRGLHPLPPPSASERQRLGAAMLEPTSGLENAQPAATRGLLGHISLQVIPPHGQLAYARLSELAVDELARGGGASGATPMVKRPTLWISSERDGWQLVVAGSTCGELPSFSFRRLDNRPFNESELRTLSLKCLDCLLACCEAKYVHGVFMLEDGGRQSAAVLGKLEQTAKAILGMIPAVAACTHATAPTDLAMLAYNCGEMLEEAYLKAKDPKLMYEAIGAYQQAAAAVNAARPGTVPARLFVSVNNALGVSLKRFAMLSCDPNAMFDMAERAYRWGMSHPRPRPDLPAFEGELSCLVNNAADLLEQRAFASPAEILALTKGGIKAQRTQTSMQMPLECATCHVPLGKEAKCCSACKVARYCSQDCQKKDWVQGHKAQCESIGKSMHAADSLP